MTPSLLKRLFAGVYETLIVLGLLVLAGFLMVPLGRALELTPINALWYTRSWVIFVVTVYFVWFWTHGGQTLPMKTWRIQLQTKDGHPLSFSLALFRLLLLLSGFGLLGIHLIWALIDPDRQFLHDRILGTRLVLKDA